MMNPNFLDALQAYYAPAILLILFGFILAHDHLLNQREKKLFFWELGVIGLMILTTWADGCVSPLTHGNWWRVRYVTSVLQFALAPLAPWFIVKIYRRSQTTHWEWLLVLPVVINAILSFTSAWTNLVIRVEPGNIYSRGPLFLLPFAVSLIYVVVLIFSASQREKKGSKLETKFLLFAGTFMAGACVLEIIFILHYMIWSTTAAILLLYFLLLTMLKVLYDQSTGLYSRLACTKRLECVTYDQPLTLAMIDLNGLKQINDRYGHAAGDQAILQVANTLRSIRIAGIKLFRYGGDEFLIMANSWCEAELIEELHRLKHNCGAIESTVLSFAYGVVEYHGGDLFELLEAADQLMYLNKAKQKAIEDPYK